jgi:hypothetical protein
VLGYLVQPGYISSNTVTGEWLSGKGVKRRYRSLEDPAFARNAIATRFDI